MSKLSKMAIVGGVYTLVVFALLFIAMQQAASESVLRAIRMGAGTGIFTMYGMAFLGLSAVAGAIVFAIAREPRA